MSGTTNTIDPNIKHAYTDSTSIWSNTTGARHRMRVGYPHNPSATTRRTSAAAARLLYTSQLSVADPGIDGLLGTADDGPNFVRRHPTGVIPASRTETRTVDGILSIDRAVDFTVTRGSATTGRSTKHPLQLDRGGGRDPNRTLQRQHGDQPVFRVVNGYHAKWDRRVAGPAVPGRRALARRISAHRRRSRRAYRASASARSPDAERRETTRRTTSAVRRGSKRFDLAQEARARSRSSTRSTSATRTNQRADQVVGRRTGPSTANSSTTSASCVERPMPPRVPNRPAAFWILPPERVEVARERPRPQLGVSQSRYRLHVDLAAPSRPSRCGAESRRSARRTAPTDGSPRSPSSSRQQRASRRARAGPSRGRVPDL